MNLTSDQSEEDLIQEVLSGENEKAHPKGEERDQESPKDEEQNSDEHEPEDLGEDEGAKEEGSEEPDSSTEDEDEPERDNADLSDGESVLAKAREQLEAGDLTAALKTAFGKTPDDFNISAKDWFAHRKATKLAQQKVSQREQQIEAKEAKLRKDIADAIDSLRPYARFAAMRKEYEASRDTDQLVKFVEEVTGADWNAVNKAVLHGSKLDPTTAKLQARIKALEEREQALSQKEHEAQMSEAKAQAKERDIQAISNHLQGTKLAKIKWAPAAVYKELERTAGADGRATISLQTATNRVLQREIKRARAAKVLLEEQSKHKEKPKAKPKNLLRRDSRAESVSSKPDPSDDDIIQDLLRSKGIA